MIFKVLHYLKRTSQVLLKEGWGETLSRINEKLKIRAKQSRLADEHCKGPGVEISGSADNAFVIKNPGVKYTGEIIRIKIEEVMLCGRTCPLGNSCGRQAVGKR